jgi:ABC-type uncharacterized transport system ATPase subunit
VIVYDVQNLVKQYPGQEHPANDHITLQIEQGEIFGILGEKRPSSCSLMNLTVSKNVLWQEGYARYLLIF